VAKPGTETPKCFLYNKGNANFLFKNGTPNQADWLFFILILGHRIKNLAGGKYRLLRN
jgi:hypothetical protein